MGLSISNCRTVYLQAAWPKEGFPPAPSTKVQKATLVFLNFMTLGFYWLISYSIDRAISWTILPAQVKISSRMQQKAKQDFEEFWNPTVVPSEKNGIVQSIRFQHLDIDESIKNYKAATIINELRSHFIPSYDTVLTPDGEEIRITSLLHIEATPLSPAIIHFNGNCEYSLSTPDLWPLMESINHDEPCTYVLFDYRGVERGSFRKASDLLIDGYSVVQWVSEKLVLSRDQIQFYGKSLGGAVAAEVQALDAEHLTGRHLNQCSFASFDRLIQELLGSGIIGSLTIALLRSRGFALDAETAFQKLQGPKMIVRHPKDRVIPESASLQSAVHHDEFMELIPCEHFENASDQHHHNAPLEWHQEATKRMGQFLFGMEDRKTLSTFF